VPLTQRRKPDSDIARRRMERRLASGRRSDERWQQVLDGAARVFRRLGYAQTTLEDIATEVGINRATLYYYVGTKEELLVSLLYRPIEQMRTELEEIVAQDLSASEKLSQALRAYLVAMSERPELFIFLSENLHKVMTGREASDIQHNADRYGRVLAGVIAEGARAGEFRDDLDPQLVVLGIMGMFNWTCRWYDPAGPTSLPELGETFVEMALSSLAPRAGGHPHVGPPRRAAARP
jgi:TetR/AcrR family transcriptional regulator, cholesterol catabolism regulator